MQDRRETLTELGVSYVAHNPRTASGDERNTRTQAEGPSAGGRTSSENIMDYLDEHYA